MRDMNGWLSRAVVCLNRARLPLLREQLREGSILQLACQKVSCVAQVYSLNRFAINRIHAAAGRNGGKWRVCHYDRKKGRPWIGTAFD